MVEEGLTLGGGHTRQHTDDASQRCALINQGHLNECNKKKNTLSNRKKKKNHFRRHRSLNFRRVEFLRFSGPSVPGLSSFKAVYPPDREERGVTASAQIMGSATPTVKSSSGTFYPGEFADTSAKNPVVWIWKLCISSVYSLPLSSK